MAYDKSKQSLKAISEGEASYLSSLYGKGMCEILRSRRVARWSEGRRWRVAYAVVGGIVAVFGRKF